MGFALLCFLCALRERKLAQVLAIKDFVMAHDETKLVANTLDLLLQKNQAGEDVFAWSDELTVTPAIDRIVNRLMSQPQSSLTHSSHSRSSFEGLLSSQVHALLKIAQYRQISFGETIYASGDPADAVYVIDQGAVRVNLADGHQHHLFENDFFGEMSLILCQAVHSSDAVAETDVDVLVLKKEALIELFLNDPIIENFMIVRAGFRSFLNKSSGPNVFMNLSEEERLALFNLFSIKRFDEGGVIVNEGEVAQEMFILLAGEILLTKEGQIEHTIVDSGFFGEISFLEQSERHMTARATKASICLCITRERFAEVLRVVPRVLIVLQDLVQRRKSENRRSKRLLQV